MSNRNVNDFNDAIQLQWNCIHKRYIGEFSRKHKNVHDNITRGYVEEFNFNGFLNSPTFNPPIGGI